MWTLAHVQWACIRAIAHTSLYVRSSPWLSPMTQPDRIENYPCRPNLYACRIFTPKDPQGKKTLPLVIRAHGGGFIINYPAADDVLARRLADQANCIVVSIDYSKAPQNKFPAAYEDVIAQSLAVIDDLELPTDKSKVVLCGSSAGGNLLLGAAQDSRLWPKILGVVSIYPAVEFEPNSDTKMATRPDPSVPDFIGKSWDTIQNLYVDEAQKPSMEDVRVSPTFFATRESLPSEVLLIGAEHDMFCRELEVMADKLAGDKAKVLSKEGWRAPGVQYYKVYGQPHAFEGFPVKDTEAEKARVAATDAMLNSISEWLINTFSKANSH
ncbi:alpha/beta-hydrolase [Dothidotthia symphoricarpi CBS 119687]|uniref:Alpha/beta-hydrolase n=1 Tax=Dothidotthia symphoricarpi CBS 119687 TaxID=1392245 RepID=A0A6A6AJ74_9PLEO|nr:alpha/beta-hydrolase [Dothidotthia symphoricarpi CBS 119687]KAF2130957.1 alpha/beta-hydrolase [Dothidotthia symphoricarpi CBS 119687]